ncbi:MAG1140 family protein [Mycoplasmopsis glycophila]|uniref:Uncharacterized protein n=1 Tax=Mycoplasmopsis glycophila TaxID=171285 RepID=A0A449AV91_9BACT|nr:hypothetical protein [Mycoplasmopsis glycophila]VEU70415.1 Uncharacterised protein [Mycoplasmopsis glycophila]
MRYLNSVKFYLFEIIVGVLLILAICFLLWILFFWEIDVYEKCLIKKENDELIIKNIDFNKLDLEKSYSFWFQINNLFYESSFQISRIENNNIFIDSEPLWNIFEAKNTEFIECAISIKKELIIINLLSFVF